MKNRKLKIFIISLTIISLVFVGILGLDYFYSIFFKKTQKTNKFEQTQDNFKNFYGSLKEQKPEDLSKSFLDQLDQSINSSQDSIKYQDETEAKDAQIGILNSGESVMQISKNLINEGPFQQSLQNPILNNQKANKNLENLIFLKKEESILFVGNGVFYLADFSFENKNYWFSVFFNDDNSINLILSEPNFFNQKVINEFSQKLLQVKKDTANNGIFYLYFENSKQKINLNKFLQNPESQNFYEKLD
jgi:hypothetical protein